MNSWFNVEESINPRNHLLAIAVCKVGDEVVGHMSTLVSSAVFHYLLGVTELFHWKLLLILIKLLKLGVHNIYKYYELANTTKLSTQMICIRRLDMADSPCILAKNVKCVYCWLV